MSYNKVDPTTGALTKIAGLVDDTDLKADIAEVQAVIPSDASSSNKLVDMSKFGAIEALTYSDADLKTFTENVCKTIKYAGSAEIPSSTNISCGFMNITQGTDQVTQMLFQFNEGKIWTRSRYGTWTSWQQITPTSTVTSGSTAPITSGGVYSALYNNSLSVLNVEAAGNNCLYQIDLTDVFSKLSVGQAVLLNFNLNTDTTNGNGLILLRKTNSTTFTKIAELSAQRIATNNVHDNTYYRVYVGGTQFSSKYASCVII